MKRFLPVLLLCLLFLAFSACALADEIVLTGETDNTFVLQPEGSSWGWSEDTLAEFYCEDWAALHQTHPGSESFTTKMLTGPLTEQPELKTFDLAGEGHFLIRADSELVPGDYTFELSVGLGDLEKKQVFTVHVVEIQAPEETHNPERFLLPVNETFTLDVADIGIKPDNWVSSVPVQIVGYYFGGEDFDLDSHFSVTMAENRRSISIKPLKQAWLTVTLRCMAGTNMVFYPRIDVGVTDAEGNLLPPEIEMTDSGENDLLVYPSTSAFCTSRYLYWFMIENADALREYEAGSKLNVDQCTIRQTGGPAEVSLFLEEDEEYDSAWYLVTKDGEEVTTPGTYEFELSLSWGSQFTKVVNFKVYAEAGTAPADAELDLPDSLDSDCVYIFISGNCTFKNWPTGDGEEMPWINMSEFIADDPDQQKMISHVLYDDVCAVCFDASGDYAGYMYAYVPDYGVCRHRLTFHVDVSENLLKLPEDLKVIGPDAFANTYVRIIDVPEGCEQIESNAFRNCYNLHAVFVPRGCVIAEDAFADCDDVRIHWK